LSHRTNHPRSVFGVRTVLVLGAGAHKDLDMPVGRKIYDELLQMLDPRGALHDIPRVNQFVDLLAAASKREPEHVRSGLTNLLLRLRTANAGTRDGVSLDMIADSSRDLTWLGRAIYAVIVAEHESRVLRALDTREQPLGLYDWLFPNLKTSDGPNGIKVLAPHDNHNFAIVTFNYDCLSEILAGRWLACRYPQNRESMREAWHGLNHWAQFDVRHVYGHLSRSYRMQPDAYIIETRDSSARDAVDVAPQSRIASPFPERIVKIDRDFGYRIDWAERLVFIGFGFDQTNLAVLFRNVSPGRPHHELTRKVQLYSTGFGLTPDKISSIRDTLRGYLGTDSVDRMQFGRPAETNFDALTRWEKDWT
jgi:hypothetical protein